MQKSKVPYGQKRPFSPADIAAIRASRVLTHGTRDKALFELGLCSALRSGDLLQLRVCDVTDSGGELVSVARIRQQKTGKGVGFNVSPLAQAALAVHIEGKKLGPDDLLFTAARRHAERPLTAQAFRDLVRKWADAAGHRDTRKFAGHTTRRSLAVAIYRSTKDIGVVSRVLGHSSLQHTSSYLGINEEAALAVASACQL